MLPPNIYNDVSSFFSWPKSLCYIESDIMRIRGPKVQAHGFSRGWLKIYRFPRYLCYDWGEGLKCKSKWDVRRWKPMQWQHMTNFFFYNIVCLKIHYIGSHGLHNIYKINILTRKSWIGDMIIYWIIWSQGHNCLLLNCTCCVILYFDHQIARSPTFKRNKIFILWNVVINT